jgi:hypothetical protein
MVDRRQVLSMKNFKIALTVLVCGMVIASIGNAQTATNDDGKIFADKAKELTQGKNTRIEKLIAIHSFVRDDIAQAKTQFG